MAKPSTHPVETLDRRPDLKGITTMRPARPFLGKIRPTPRSKGDYDGVLVEVFPPKGLDRRPDLKGITTCKVSNRIQNQIRPTPRSKGDYDAYWCCRHLNSDIRPTPRSKGDYDVRGLVFGAVEQLDRRPDLKGITTLIHLQSSSAKN